jgi:hypothetical protein
MKLLVFVGMTQIGNAAELKRRGATSTEVGSEIRPRIVQLETLENETSTLYIMDPRGLGLDTVLTIPLHAVFTSGDPSRRGAKYWMLVKKWTFGKRPYKLYTYIVVSMVYNIDTRQNVGSYLYSLLLSIEVQ